MVLLAGFSVTIADYSIADAEDAEGTCLLANSFSSGNRITISVEADAQAQPTSLLMKNSVSRRMKNMLGDAAEHRSWRAENLKLWYAANESKGILDTFISQQEDSSDFCSSRLKEAKRALDGLLHDLHDLTIEVQSHEEVLATETENLNITYMSIEAVEEKYNKHLERCKEEQASALDELRQYRAEVEELEQIAKPSVRYDHTMKHKSSMMGENFAAAEETEAEALTEANCDDEGLTGAERIKCRATKRLEKSTKRKEKRTKRRAKTALLEEGAWTLDQCEKFVAFVEHHNQSSLLQWPEMLFAEAVEHASLGNFSFLAMHQRGAGCSSVTSEVNVTVGSITKTIRPKKDLKDKGQGSYPCYSINPDYHGLVWMNCMNGNLLFDARRCFKPEERDVATTTAPIETTPEAETAEEEIEEVPTMAPEPKPVPSPTPAPTQVPKPAKPLSCDLQREELQKAFTKAWVDVKDLESEAKGRSEDESCAEIARSEKAAEMVPLVAARDQASARIQHSGAALAALEPVLNLLKDRVAKLRAHIKKTLIPECKEADEVSEYLEKVRELIISLEECPGRNDFELRVPGDDAPKATLLHREVDVQPRAGSGHPRSNSKMVLMHDRVDSLGKLY